MSELIKYMASSDCMFLESPEFEHWYMAKPDELFVKESDYARLKAEVERLRKAGDAMAEIVEGTYCIDKPPALIAWNAAKKGNV